VSGGFLDLLERLADAGVEFVLVGERVILPGT
jgi:hypothetical protein